ncbi:unnamed protein product, partial [Mesorhabditis spiculigera]
MSAPWPNVSDSSFAGVQHPFETQVRLGAGQPPPTAGPVPQVSAFPSVAELECQFGFRYRNPESIDSSSSSSTRSPSPENFGSTSRPRSLSPLRRPNRPGDIDTALAHDPRFLAVATDIDVESSAEYLTPPPMPPPGLVPSIREEPIRELIDINGIETALHNFATGQLDRSRFVVELHAHMGLYNRLHEPFQRFEDNMKTLHLLLLTCQNAADEFRLRTVQVLQAVAGSGFFTTLLHGGLIPQLECCARNPDYFAFCLGTMLNLMELFSVFGLTGEAWTDLLDILQQIAEEVPSTVRNSMGLDLEQMFGRLYDQVAIQHDIEGSRGRDFALEKQTLESVEEFNTLKKGLIDPLANQLPPTLEAEPTPYRTLWAECERTEPPCEFRNLSSEIAVDDIADTSAIPYLRRMKVEGWFKNGDEYLDIVYRLFREDLVSTLRNGLYIWKQHNYQLGRDAGGYSADLFVVQDVRLRGVQVKSGSGEPMRLAEIPYATVSRVIESRKLSYGQLVVLSTDGFKSDILLGIVGERDDDLLRARQSVGIILIEERDRGLGSVQVKLDTEYQLVESNAFLEMYTPVLMAIQSLNRFLPVPFESYIVHGNTNVSRPLYLRNIEARRALPPLDIDIYYENKLRRKKAEFKLWLQDQNAAAALKPHIGDHADGEDEARASKKQRRKQKKTAQSNTLDFDGGSSQSDAANANPEMAQLCREINEAEDYVRRPQFDIYAASRRKMVRIRGLDYDLEQIHEKFDPTHVFMDFSQREALLTALTNEFAIIQGPPGTGKTFIGVEIVAAMLASRPYWGVREPIIVVCFTNQALDQFLEKINERILHDMASGEITDNEGPTVVRLGSRCESAYIKDDYKLMKRDVCDFYRDTVPPLKGVSRRRVYEDFELAEAALGEAVALLRLARRDLISGKCIFSIMSRQHQEQFIREYHGHLDTKGQPMSVDEKLAAWLLNRDFTMDAPLPEIFVDTEDDSEDPEAYDARLADALRKEAQMKKLEAACEAWGIGEEKKKSPVGFVEDTYEVRDFWILGRDVNAMAKQFENQVIMWGKRNKKTDLLNKYNRNIEVCQDPAIRAAITAVQATVLAAVPLTHDEASAIKNITTLPKERRWQLYAYWRIRLYDDTRKQMPRLMARYRDACTEKKEMLQREDANVLRNALVIGATTTGAAKYRDLLLKVNCRQLIVEEAAEVLEGHVLASLLPTLQHVVMIGDHQQLRPNPSNYELGRSYNLNVSMFERLHRNGFPCTSLLKQHRMRPEITEYIVRPHFYYKLEDHEIVMEYPPVAGMGKNLFFWEHDEPEEALPWDNTSRKNNYEVKQAIALTRYLLQQGVYQKSDITIISTYAAQSSQMRYEVSAAFGTTAEGRPEVPVETLDGFQGKENKIIILSLVRSTNRDGTIGFLSDKHRVCVAWTRAKHGLFVLGNMDFIASR